MSDSSWGFNAALNSLSTVPATDGFALQLLDQMVKKQVRSIATSSVFERSVRHKLTRDWDFSYGQRPFPNLVHFFMFLRLRLFEASATCKFLNRCSECRKEDDTRRLVFVKAIFRCFWWNWGQSKCWQFQSSCHLLRERPDWLYSSPWYLDQFWPLQLGDK